MGWRSAPDDRTCLPLSERDEIHADGREGNEADAERGVGDDYRVCEHQWREIGESGYTRMVMRAECCCYGDLGVGRMRRLRVLFVEGGLLLEDKIFLVGYQKKFRTILEPCHF